MKPQWLITGAGGQLGSVLLQEVCRCDDAALGLLSPKGPAPAFGLTTRSDITDLNSLAEIVRSLPGLRYIIHTAAITAVGAAHANPELAHRTNVAATRRLAELAEHVGARLIVLSTDLVFDGTSAPYSETALLRPLSVYGRSKAEAERAVCGFPDVLVVRPPLMYGLPAVDRPTTFRRQIDAIRAGQALQLFEDEFRTPISLIDAARACLKAATSGLTGILHVGGPERLSRLEMGRMTARALGCSDRHIVPIRQADMQFAEPRPTDVSLDSRLFQDTFSQPAGRPMLDAMADVVLSSGLSPA